MSLKYCICIVTDPCKPNLIKHIRVGIGVTDEMTTATIDLHSFQMFGKYSRQARRVDRGGGGLRGSQVFGFKTPKAGGGGGMKSATPAAAGGEATNGVEEPRQSRVFAKGTCTYDVLVHSLRTPEADKSG